MVKFYETLYHEYYHRVLFNADIKGFDIQMRLDPIDSLFGSRTSYSQLHYTIKAEESFFFYTEFIIFLQLWINPLV